MSGCTAPVEGHRSARAAANCPVCRYRARSRPSYSRPSYASPVYAPSVPRYPSSGGSGSNGGGSIRSKGGRTYTRTEWRTLEPVRSAVGRQVQFQSLPDRRDLFLCHAWDDRLGPAKELNDLLVSNGVSVWFSENEVGLGTSLLRSIDKGLKNSRAGVVLVTPKLFTSLNREGSIADKELSALLATDRVIPVAHGTTFEALRDVSPLLAARSGLTTGEASSLEDVAAKIAETVLLVEMA
jgi:TIR domain